MNIIQSSDIFEFERLPNPQSVGIKSQLISPHDFSTHYRPGVGAITFRNMMFPHLHIMELGWEMQDDIELCNSDSSDNVNINFHLHGDLRTRFVGLNRELEMRPGKHNMVFSPEGGYRNRFAPNKPVRMFHISLERSYFMAALGCDDRWSESVQEDLLKHRPLIGSKESPHVTPGMSQLISQIRNCSETGPMRNLIVQSRLLELLSLQLQQFRGGAAHDAKIPVDDTEKLYQLKAFLDTHFLQELSLDRLSRVCTLNEFKVKKGFKTLFGNTVFGYLRQLRMSHAQRLLLDHAMTVEEVAGILGYEHPQHFSTAFKKFTGRNPSEVHKKLSHLV